MNTSGCFTMPWMTSLCWAGSMSGTPPWQIVKCRPFGVMMPLSRWCGVRARELRGSFFGLSTVRTTAFSNRDGVWYGGMASPTSRLHGPSLSGSAAAPVAAPTAPAPMAPASMTPRPSSARRSSRPLPATCSIPNLLILDDMVSPLEDTRGPLAGPRRAMRRATEHVSSLVASGGRRRPSGADPARGELNAWPGRAE